MTGILIGGIRFPSRIRKLRCAVRSEKTLQLAGYACADGEFPGRRRQPLSTDERHEDERVLSPVEAQLRDRVLMWIGRRTQRRLLAHGRRRHGIIASQVWRLWLRL